MDEVSSSSSDTSSSSSSNIEQSSSSEVGSSSSGDVSSSFSDTSSSSSENSSSSSADVSSSSGGSSSSSAIIYGDWCKDFDPDTEVEHYGKMKKQLCDPRDDKRYAYVEIGDQTWMAENLNLEAIGSKCGDGYILSSANTEICDKYGRLYDWSTTMGFDEACNTNFCLDQLETPHRGICPVGWHVPSKDEWSTLSSFIKTNHGNYVGTYLKATSDWKDDEGRTGNGDDTFGFSALPGGFGSPGGSITFAYVGELSYWWSSTENSSIDWLKNNAYNQYIMYQNVAFFSGEIGKNLLYSVRCMKD
jgi:uncharacterized protein (TIGR02145 family)